MDNSSYERILGILCSVFEAYTAVLFLPDNSLPSTKGTEESEHHLATSFSLGNKVDKTAYLKPGQGLVGWIIRNKSPLLVPNFDQRRNFLGYYTDNEEQNIKAFMGCALPGGRGVVCVDSKRQYSFSEKDQKLLHLFCGLLAEVYDSTRQNEAQGAALRYYAALRFIYVLRREHSRWAEFLHSFLDIVSKASGFEYAALCTLDPNGEYYNVEGENYTLLCKNGQSDSYPLSSGMVGWVFRNGTPLSSGGPDGAPEAPLLGRGVSIPAFQSLLAIPLIIQRKVRGVLCLASELPVDIGSEVQEFVRMSAEHLALFLENLFVKCRLRDLHQSIMAESDKVV